MFFGYIIELTNARMVWAGHLEYERLYSSADFDFFISPGTLFREDAPRRPAALRIQVPDSRHGAV